jgi:hypothetical protein
LLHVVVNAPGGFGRPSSLTVPDSDADPGSTIAWSPPAFTSGAWFAAGFTVTTMSSDAFSAPSFALSLSV